MNRKAKLSYILSHLIEGILSIPKSIYFNIAVLPLNEAIKCPVIISHRIKLEGINRKSIIIKGEKRFACIRIGFGASRFSIESSRKGMIRVENGVIEIGENSGFSEGVILDAKNARIIFGKHFRCNYATLIAAENDDIVFGDEDVLGWRINIRNYDGHTIIDNGRKKTNHERIIIGDHVWICAHSDILKGTVIGADSVVGYGSLVNGKFDADNVLIAGKPARIIKESINWEE